MEKVYFIQRECNDRGWFPGIHYYSNKEAAIASMRRHVAYKIRQERFNGNKVEYLKVWRDSVMNSYDEKAISITFKVTDKEWKEFFYDFRIWCADLHSEPLPAEMCCNF